METKFRNTIVYLTSCCFWELVGELEPIGLYSAHSLHNNKEFYVFQGDIEGFTFKLCNKSSCEMILKVYNKLGEK